MLIAWTAFATVCHNNALPDTLRTSLLIVSYQTPLGFYLLKYYILRYTVNPLNSKLNPICHFLASLGTHHILHVSRIRVNCPFQRISGKKKTNNFDLH